jgi:hypothetical protein
MLQCGIIFIIAYSVVQVMRYLAKVGSKHGDKELTGKLAQSLENRC